METILFETTVYLLAAVVVVPLSQRFGFGSVLGYLTAGLVIGPILGLVGAETEEVQHFAEYGVVFMLFLIGLEMKPKTLWDMRVRLLGLGGLQVGATVAAIALAANLLGLPWNQAVTVGIILSLSSTAIVMQTLNEKKLAHGEGGRAAFAVLLFQDLAAVPLLALIPLLALGGGAAPPPPLDPGPFPVITGWLKAAMVVGVVAAVILGGRFLTHPLYRYIGMARLPEIQTAAALLLVAAISAALNLINLSPALGSFLAGVVLANSEYRHELESDLAPFKGLLMGLFFITVGAGIDLELLASDAARIVALTLLLMLLKATVLYPLAGVFKLAGDARLLFALALAQAGEFGFFLLAFARETGALPAGVTAHVLLIVSLSMFLTPALFLLHDRLGPRFKAPADRAAEPVDAEGPVIVAGMGRFGQTVNRMLAGAGVKTVVLDNRPETVNRMRALGVEAFYGAVERPDLLAAAGVAKARAVVVAIDDPDKAVAIVRHLHRRHPEVKVIARARDRHHVYRLHAAGAPETVRELFDGAVRAAGLALGALGFEADEIARVEAAFVENDRRLLADLAALWDPDAPPERNPAYLARERAQTAEIEAALRPRSQPDDASPAGVAAPADDDESSGDVATQHVST